jgi:uncharacterized glyoxalase superfamily protein PhnB
MVQNPPEGMPQVTPYLLYEDVGSTVDWLIATFGFEEAVRMPGPDGKTFHAELTMGSGRVMMGTPSPDYQNPKKRGGATQLTYVYVDDVDKHYEKAKAAGAIIVNELADQFYGDRTYGAEDPEGHSWSFAQHVKDVAPDDMHP